MELTQASFGPSAIDDLMALEKIGFENNETETELYKYLSGLIRLRAKQLTNYLQDEGKSLCFNDREKKSRT